MKKLVMLIPLVVLLTFAISCKKEKVSSTKPRLLSSFTYSEGIDSANSFQKDTFLYNNLGQLIRSESEYKYVFNSTLNRKAYAEYEYNSEGLLAKKLEVGTLGNFYSISTIYSYNNSKISSYSFTSSSSSTSISYEYNSKGILSKKTEIRNGVTSIFTYTYDNNDVIQSYTHQSPPSTAVGTYTVNNWSNSNLIADMVYNNGNSRYVAAYDEVGNETQSISYISNVKDYTYTTVFDNKKTIRSLLAQEPETREPFFGKSEYNATKNVLSQTILHNFNGSEYVQSLRTNVYEYNAQGYPTKVTFTGINYNPDGSIQQPVEYPRVTKYNIVER
jgi:hypothetical protein